MHLNITWLKKILSNYGKITNIPNALRPAVKLIKDRRGEFANILMMRANNSFWVDVFKHYRNLCYGCVRFPSMILQPGVYIII